MSDGKVDLRQEQAATLSRPRMTYLPMARMLFRAMDAAYGKELTYPKVRMLETLARIPYQAWETRHYSLLSTRHKDLAEVERAEKVIGWGRSAQDNEFWHLLVIEEKMRQEGMREGRFWEAMAPRLACFKYAWFCRILARLNLRRAFYLNAEFEDHAEHEYMHFVATHPELERQKVEGDVIQKFGPFDSWADVFRRIGLDEREHMNNSFRFYGTPERVVPYASIPGSAP